MLQAYSVNQAAAAAAPIQFNNVTTEKGCTTSLTSNATIELNRKGVYMVAFDGVASADTTVQLYKDGVAQPQAQTSGTTLGFLTLVQVDRDNCGCCCSSPVRLQLINTDAVTYDNANVVVTKVC